MISGGNVSRTMSTDLLTDFEARGLVHQSTDPAALRTWLGMPGRRVYAGFDPTADSLHVGHLVARHEHIGVSCKVMRGARM